MKESKTMMYPPGGLMVWIFISAEMITFGLFFLAYAYSEQSDPEHFGPSKALLNPLVAAINTVILVTSGFLAALASHAMERGKAKETAWLLVSASFLGIAFLVIKGWEYVSKYAMDITMSTDTFFSFYYFLTLLHFLHVLLGLVILFAVAGKALKGMYTAENHMGVKTATAYWHMCDLIWLILFPLIYLAH